MGWHTQYCWALEHTTNIEYISYLYGSKYDITYLVDMPNQKHNFQSGLQSKSS